MIRLHRAQLGFTEFRLVVTSLTGFIDSASKLLPSLPSKGAVLPSFTGRFCFSFLSSSNRISHFDAGQLTDTFSTGFSISFGRVWQGSIGFSIGFLLGFTAFSFLFLFPRFYRVSSTTFRASFFFFAPSKELSSSSSNRVFLGFRCAFFSSYWGVVNWVSAKGTCSLNGR